MVYLNIYMKTFEIFSVTKIGTMPSSKRAAYKIRLFSKNSSQCQVKSFYALKVGRIQEMKSIKTACQSTRFDNDNHVKIQQKQFFEE